MRDSHSDKNFEQVMKDPLDPVGAVPNVIGSIYEVDGDGVQDQLAKVTFIEYLASIKPGPIPDTIELEPLLVACWQQLDGGDAQGMAFYKLRGRMEEVEWEPPILSFTIERHGATVMGSTRADLQRWQVNVDERTAICWTAGTRQVYPRQPPLDVRSIAEEIAQLVVNHQEDERLRWKKDGSVHVNISRILPEGSAVKQTLEGRRIRMRDAVQERLNQEGWQKVGGNVYAPPATE